MTLIPVDPKLTEHVQFLYALLKERPKVANISHKKMPTFKQHSMFVSSQPYKLWYVIEALDDGGGCIEDGAAPCLVGSVYITKADEIGIFIKAEHQGRGIAGQAIKAIEGKAKGNTILANIAPGNEKSIRLFTKLGYKLVQYTYKKEV